jgi:hypothetical protein
MCFLTVSRVYDEVAGGPLAGCADGGRVRHRDRELTAGLR